MKRVTILWLNWIAMAIVAGGLFIVWAATDTDWACATWGIAMVFVMAAYLAYSFEREF